MREICFQQTKEEINKLVQRRENVVSGMQMRMLFGTCKGEEKKLRIFIALSMQRSIRMRENQIINEMQRKKS